LLIILVIEEASPNFCESLKRNPSLIGEDKSESRACLDDAEGRRTYVWKWKYQMEVARCLRSTKAYFEKSRPSTFVRIAQEHVSSETIESLKTKLKFEYKL